VPRVKAPLEMSLLYIFGVSLLILSFGGATQTLDANSCTPIIDGWRFNISELSSPTDPFFTQGHFFLAHNFLSFLFLKARVRGTLPLCVVTLARRQV